MCATRRMRYFSAIHKNANATSYVHVKQIKTITQLK